MMLSNTCSNGSATRILETGDIDRKLPSMGNYIWQILLIKAQK